jgi:hypothetical protein
MNFNHRQFVQTTMMQHPSSAEKSRSRKQKMKTAIKTITTQSRLRRHRECFEVPAYTADSSQSETVCSAVEFQQEELDEFRPLKPDEADEVKLAEFFQNHDFTFLFESSQPNESCRNNTQDANNNRKRIASLSLRHVIPTESGSDHSTYAAKGSKRARLSP